MKEHNNHTEQLLTALDQLKDQENMSPAPLSKEQNNRICALAMKKANSAVTPKKNRNHSLRHAMRVSLIAAALACASVMTVYAVGPKLAAMLQNKIQFFEDASTPSEIHDPLEAPRADYTETKKKLEIFNAAVGQTASDNGVNITLDNISMDIASMDVFFTINAEEAIQEILSTDDYSPGWSQFFGCGPDFLYPEINGKPLGRADMEDWYRAEDGSLKLWKHYPLTEIPEGEEIIVTLSENRKALNRKGSWSFTVSLDGNSVRAGGKIADPKVYPLPERTYTLSDGTEFTGSQDIHLEYLAFGPKGGMMETKVTERQKKDKSGTSVYIWDGTPADNLYITDSTGKEIQPSHSGINNENTLNLTAPDPDAVSITLTPLRYDTLGKKPEECSWENRSISTEELRAGAKIETSPIGGYTVQNFMLKNSWISYELVPYGWNSSWELIPDDDQISMVSEKVTNSDGNNGVVYHSALLSSTVDPQTGIITVRHDYYAADENELNQIETWHYSYNPHVALDTEHAVTIPLHAVLP